MLEFHLQFIQTSTSFDFEVNCSPLTLTKWLAKLSNCLMDLPVSRDVRFLVKFWKSEDARGQTMLS